MAKKRTRRPGSGRSLEARLAALAGLVVTVGGVVAILVVVGFIGNQGGGTTETGIEIEDVTLVEAPPVAALGDLDVSPREGQLAPDFVISDFDGTRHRLSDFRGKPVYVNFWATWCLPCQIELPDMQELLDRHEDDLVIITVNRAEPLNRAKTYFANIEKLNGEPGISFTVNGLDTDDRLYNEYRGLGMPVSVFIDANGVVTRVYNSLLLLPQMEEAVAEAAASARALDGEASGS